MARKAGTTKSNDTQLVRAAVREIIQFLDVAPKTILHASNTSFMRPKHGDKSGDFRLPNWERIDDRVAELFKSSGTLQQVERRFGEMGGRASVVSLTGVVRNLSVARAYQLIRIKSIQTELRVVLEKAIRGIFTIESYAFGEPGRRMRDEVNLGHAARLIPAKAAIIKYFLAQWSRWRSDFGGALRLIDIPDLGQPMIVLKSEVRPPKEPDGGAQWRLKRRAEVGLELVTRTCCLFARQLPSPMSLGANVSTSSSVNPPRPSTSFLGKRHITKLKRMWPVLARVPDLADPSSSSRLAVCARRYSSGLQESEPDAYIDLMIAVESLLGEKGNKDELRYRYSLMAAAALSFRG